MKDLNYAPNKQDRKQNLAFQEMLTQEMEGFSQILNHNYKQKAVLINEVKSGLNNYIYRPIKKTAIDSD